MKEDVEWRVNIMAVLHVTVTWLLYESFIVAYLK